MSAILDGFGDLLADPLVGPILKGTMSALPIAFGAWLFIEQGVGRLPKILFDRIAPFRLFFSQSLGISLVMLGHAGDVVSYGTGPGGWCRAVLFGFLAGTLPTVVHPFLKKRFSWLTVSSSEGGQT